MLQKGPFCLPLNYIFSLVTISLLDENMQDQQDLLKYETLTSPNNLMNNTVKNVNILSNAIKINHKVALLVFYHFYFCEQGQFLLLQEHSLIY